MSIVARFLVLVIVLAAGFFAGMFYQNNQKAHSAQNLALLAAQDEAAWYSHFVQSLYRAGDLVESYSEALTDLDKREGYRLITRMMALGFDRILETANPAAPQFYRLQSAQRKFAGDAPDQLYHAANISGKYRYRISGQLYTDEQATTPLNTLLIEASVYGGNLSFDGSSNRRLVSHIDESDLVTDDQGRFEIILSKEPEGDNWLALEDDVKNVLLRRYFAGPQLHDLLPLTIERIDDVVDYQPLTEKQLVKGMLGTAAMVEETVRYWHDWVNDTRAASGVNQLVALKDDGDLLTPAGIKYIQGAWELKSNQALKISFTPPNVPYWSFVPMNMWMESFDWHLMPRGMQVSTNNYMSSKEPDGSVVLYLSEQDPDHPNWIYTQGHSAGLMSFRFARMAGQSLPEFKIELISLQ